MTKKHLLNHGSTRINTDLPRTHEIGAWVINRSLNVSLDKQGVESKVLKMFLDYQLGQFIFLLNTGG